MGSFLEAVCVDFLEHIDQSTVAGMEPIAESDQFAVYAVGNQTYLLVQRHAGSPWLALRLSGDGVFRVGSLMVDAMRHLYREVASQLSPNHRKDGSERRRDIATAESGQPF
jgi:hypothetical protein